MCITLEFLHSFDCTQSRILLICCVIPINSWTSDGTISHSIGEGNQNENKIENETEISLLSCSAPIEDKHEKMQPPIPTN